MKSIYFLVSLIVLGFLLQQFLPWWILAPVAAILAGLLKLTPRQAFIASLLGGILLWGGYALYLDNGILSNRLGQMMGDISPVLLFLLPCLIGGLIAAMGGVTGSLGRIAFSDINK
jgi:hypothetical protein